MRWSWWTSEQEARGWASHCREGHQCILLDFVTKKLVVKIRKNKVVVGSGHGDMPKYAGEGVVLCRTLGTLGVLWLQFSCSVAIFRQFLVGVLRPKHIILFSDVMSLKGAVTSYVTSQHCMCIGHMTFCYKRPTNTSVGGSGLLFVHSSGSTLSPETCMWLVPNACRS